MFFTVLLLKSQDARYLTPPQAAGNSEGREISKRLPSTWKDVEDRRFAWW
ncbi:hypothetical protein ACL1EU_04715 [Corynebacterium striatum]